MQVVDFPRPYRDFGFRHEEYPMKGGFSFSQVPIADIPRSSFNRTHTHKTTFNAGYLIPFYVDEALPGDTFNVRASLFARLATPIAPIMDNMYMDVFFFSVPNRLLWVNWQHFMGEQDNPGDSIDFLVPIITGGEAGFAPGSIFDYFGVPVGAGGGDCVISALFPRAYNRIWNEWFRDENLQSRVDQETDNGPDDPSQYALLRRGKRHDYFTSCLPWPQKGPGVSLPLGTTAPLIPSSGITGPRVGVDDVGASHLTTPIRIPAGTGIQPLQVNLGAGTFLAQDVDFPIPTDYVADLTHATAATINSLRQAFQIQRLLERDARGGTRYVELLRSHFGVVSPDARLQRPEFLGGGTIPIVINPVAQTSGTISSGADASPQGNLAAFGVAGGHGIGFTKSFVEHCVVMGMVCVRAELSYQQGLPRMFSRRTRYDFYWPSFAHLGEQAVLNKEIMYVNDSRDEEVFGYQERWAEYRYFPSKITGLFRSDNATPLDVWHLAQEFTTGNPPTLNETFIVENPPVERVIAVPSEPHFLFDSHISIQAARPMPTYSVPGLIDHF